MNSTSNKAPNDRHRLRLDELLNSKKLIVMTVVDGITRIESANIASKDSYIIEERRLTLDTVVNLRLMTDHCRHRTKMNVKTTMIRQLVKQNSSYMLITNARYFGSDLAWLLSVSKSTDIVSRLEKHDVPAPKLFLDRFNYAVHKKLISARHGFTSGLPNTEISVNLSLSDNTKATEFLLDLMYNTNTSKAFEKSHGIKLTQINFEQTKSTQELKDMIIQNVDALVDLLTGKNLQKNF